MFEMGILETIGPRIVMALVGLFFLAVFIGGFYWESYVLPARMGPWVVDAPGKYMLMISFFMVSFIFLSAALFLYRYKKLYQVFGLAAFALFVAGALVFG